MKGGVKYRNRNLQNLKIIYNIIIIFLLLLLLLLFLQSISYKQHGHKEKGKIKRQKAHITMGWYILKLNGVRGG